MDICVRYTLITCLFYHALKYITSYYLILYLYDAVVHSPSVLVSLLQGGYINIWLFVKYTKTS